MKLIIAGNINDIKNLLFAFKYENMMREIVLYISDNEHPEDSSLFSYTRLQNKEDLVSFFKNHSPLFIIADQNPDNRKLLINSFEKLGGLLISFYSSKSLISRFNSISEKGVIIQMQSDISADVRIEEGVFIGMQCLVGHDVKIGKHTTISDKTNILGYVEIGANCTISHGVTIMPSVKIGNNVKIGPNCIIKKNVLDNEILTSDL